MKQSIKTIMISAALIITGFIGFSISSLYGNHILYENMDAEDKPLRLHILANSDSAEDQQIKLALRDHIIGYLEESLEQANNKNEAVSRLQDILPQLEESCNSFVGQYTDDNVTASIERCDFPAIDYAGTIFAAGEYDALRIVIGSGSGHNWWCVLFPPLCFVDLAAEIDEDAAVAAIAGSDKSNTSLFNIEFKILELWNRQEQDN